MSNPIPRNWRDLADQLPAGEWQKLERIEIETYIDNVEYFVQEGRFVTDAALDRLMVDIALARLSKV